MLHPYLQELYAKTLDGHDLFTVGEVNDSTLEGAFQIFVRIEILKSCR